MDLHLHETQILASIFERLFPADDRSLGAEEIGVALYVEQALAGADRDSLDLYRFGLSTLERAAKSAYATAFAQCSAAQQDSLLAQLERGELMGLAASTQQSFFALLCRHMQEGLFADPAYGGNRQMHGWKFLGHPGVWLENSAAEALSAEPVTKGGITQSLHDLGYHLNAAHLERDEIEGYDPFLGTQPPTFPADVVIVGLGAVGALVAPLLAQAGLRVVALEAGPWRTKSAFVPDELGVAFYARATMGPKFRDETPRWRRHALEPTVEATFSLGRMVNGVGGSTAHYGAWLRRFHPHHFQFRSHVRQQWGEDALPEHNTLADRPLTYQDLAPYYDELESEIGIAGDNQNPFIPRSTPYPMPPLRPFRMGELFRQTTAAMGLHPHTVPVGLNSIPYAGRPATTYSGWGSGFVSFDDSRWTPGLQTLPQALASGNLEVRTGCRALRVCTDSAGRATGVEYVSATGERYVQEARTVILAGYTFENVRLLLLSGDSKHAEGLGNTSGSGGQTFYEQDVCACRW